MPRLSLALAAACVLMIPFVAKAMPGNGCLDPVTTYTNGMPLASSTPLRSHNVYYQCDPGRLGCCGGYYNRPCVNSLFAPNDCCTSARSTYLSDGDNAWTAAVETPAANVEPATFEQLGSIPNDGVGVAAGGIGAPGGSPTPSLLQNLVPR